MKYGYLNYNSQNPEAEYTGKIACRIINAQLKFSSEDKGGNSNAPDYSVWAKEGGNVYQLGNAWRKNGKDGSQFLSITLDSPDMDVPLNVTAFEVKGKPDELEIVWQRPRQDRKAKEAVQPVDNGTKSEEIPF